MAGAVISPVGTQSPLIQNDPTSYAVTWLTQWMNDVTNAGKTLWYSCTTAQRPTDPYLGQIILDTTVPGIFYCDTIRNAATSTPAHWTQLTSGGGGTVTSVSGTDPIFITGTPTVNPDVNVKDFVASGVGHDRGTVVDPGAVAGITRFLREDATWQVPPGGGTGFFWAVVLGGN